MAVTIIPNLLPTKPTISTPLTISIFFLLVFLINNVTSDFSFNFPNSPTNAVNIGVANDAALSNRVIQLTNKDKNGNPLQHSVGQSGWNDPIRIYDNSNAKVADFITEFTFVVNRKGKKDHGDGFAFFIVSPDFNFPNATESEGGFLGMFTPETAFRSNKQQVLLVEFDSFANDWDPNPVSHQTPHLGIDVNSIKSVVVASWYSDFESDERVAKACIEYDFGVKKLKVSVTYSMNGQPNFGDSSSLVYGIDLTSILPEKNFIVFSAATGDLVETHDICSWSFTSNL